MEEDLKKLGTLKAPAASAEAKARALAAAMTAFEHEKNIESLPQGSANGQRQSSIRTLIWSYVMNRKMLAGSALATIMVVPLAGYLTIGYLDEKTKTLGEVPQLADATPVKKKEHIATALKDADKVAEGRVDSDQSASSAQASANNPSAGKPLSADKNNKVADTASMPADSAKTPVPEPSTVENEETSDLLGKSTAADENTGVKTEQFAAKPMTVQPTGVLSKKVLGGAVSTEAAPVEAVAPPVFQPASGDRFTSKDINPVKSVATDPVSTFSIDVDTASYSYARSQIMDGRLPEADSVRVEEMINYFPYDWRGPDKADEAFRANVSVMPTPWNKDTKLLHIGIKGYDLVQAEQPPANLVFLIDVSGSMDEPNKLPLLKSAFRLLVQKLKPTDTVSIVTYAGDSGVVLEPTKASDKQKILAAIDSLTPGGGTDGADGIKTAYDLARKAFVKNGVNRVLLATDGDFNVGPSSDEDLKSIIVEERKSGIFLSVLGFGTGNYNDALMQALAQNGNGTAAYIDTLSEAQKTLVQEATSSLFTIAKDVKIQVEFNPAQIAEYRLIGYETRALNREDFNNDKVDAGEIGSGHRVTAIYEITPVGSKAVLNDPLRYGDKKPSTAESDKATDELAFVKIRYKKPNEDKSVLVTMPVGIAQQKASIDAEPEDVRFSVAVAAFGQKLKGEAPVADYSWDAIRALASSAKGEDPFGYRAEFVKMVDLTKSLKGE